jgi:hypothetical protein
MITRALDLAWHFLFAMPVTAWLDRIESKPLPAAVQ